MKLFCLVILGRIQKIKAGCSNGTVYYSKNEKIKVKTVIGYTATYTGIS